MTTWPHALKCELAPALLRDSRAARDATGAAALNKVKQPCKTSPDREREPASPAPEPARAQSTIQAGGDQEGGKDDGKEDACKSAGKSRVAEESDGEALPVLPAKRVADTRLQTSTSQSSPKSEGSSSTKSQDSDEHSDELDPDAHCLTGEARTRVMARST